MLVISKLVFSTYARNNFNIEGQVSQTLRHREQINHKQTHSYEEGLLKFHPLSFKFLVTASGLLPSICLNSHGWNLTMSTNTHNLLISLEHPFLTTAGKCCRFLLICFWVQVAYLKQKKLSYLIRWSAYKIKVISNPITNFLLLKRSNYNTTVQ